MTKTLFYLAITVVYLLSATGCGSDYIFQKKLDIREGEWRYNDVLTFDFDIEDVSKKYDLLLDVTHAGDYGFQNLYVQFHTSYPSGEKKTQMVSLELATKSGIWNGKCSGNSCTVEIPLQANATFDEAGKHSISIEQFMRKNPLQGVESMTLKILARAEEQ